MLAIEKSRTRKRPAEAATEATIEDVAEERVSPDSSGSVAFRRLPIDLGDQPCEGVVYVAQDADGKWFGSSSFKWTIEVPWPALDSVLVPMLARKFGDWKDAVEGQVGRLKAYLGKCRETAGTPRLLQIAAEAAVEVMAFGDAAAQMPRLPGGDVSGKTQLEDGAKNRGTDVPRSPARTDGTGAPTRSAEVEIPVEKVHRRPDNRGGVEVSAAEVSDLAASIDRFGLSTPVEVRATSEEQDLPVGHYELLKGERRWKAHQVLGRETIRAVVVECDAAAAAAAVAVDNTHRRDLDPIARARGIRDAQARGLSLEDAGLAHGLGASASKNALRLLELPESVQAAVTSGQLAQAVAIAAVPLLAVPGVAEELERAVKKKEWWLNRVDDARAILERQLLPKHAVPIQRQKPEAWERQEVVVADPKRLKPEDREALGVVEVRAGNRPTLYATNLDEVKRRKEAAAAAAEQREQAQRKKAVAEGKPANPAAEKQQDESLQAKTEELYYLWLRLLIAEALEPGDPRTLRVGWWVRSAAGDQYGNPIHLCDWEIVLAQFCRREMPRRGKSDSWLRPSQRIDAWTRSGLLIRHDGPDPCADHVEQECLLAQLILWPVWPARRRVVSEDREIGEYDAAVCEHVVEPTGSVPRKYPDLRRDEVDAVAYWLTTTEGLTGSLAWETTIADGWRMAAEGGMHQQMLLEWLSRHNGRQLERLCRELKVEIDPGAKVADRRKEIVSRHSERRLPLPKVFATLGRKRK